MSKIVRKKNKCNSIYERASILDWVSLIYLIFIFGVYPLIMHNKYFDITITRYNWFTYGTIAFIIVGILSLVIDKMICKKLGENHINFDLKIKSIFGTVDFYFVMFVLANFAAWIMADDKKSALSGSSGRYFGLAIVIIIGLMYLVLSRSIRMSYVYIAVIGSISLVTMLIAYLQYVGIDIFQLRGNIASDQIDSFISTFGNINIFSSYLSMILPFFIALFIFSNNKYINIFSAIVIFCGSISMVIAKSDGSYLALFISFYILLYIAIVKDKILKYILSAIILFGGYFSFAIRNFFYSESYVEIDGIVKSFTSVKLLGIVLLILIIVFGIMYILINYNNKIPRINKKHIILLCIVISIVSAVIIIIYGVKSGNKWFVFDYNWGSKRGLIWAKSVELFTNAPLSNKLFGYGNETIKQLTTIYSTEIMELTNSTYDNAHNEVLQYLVTTGLFGVLSYIGIFVSTIIYTIKSKIRTEYVYCLLFAVIGYFTQAMVNINQPITTPFYFVFITMLVGHIRYEKYSKIHMES